MNHLASPEFWESYQRLPPSIQKLADKNFRLLKANPSHPSLQFKRVGNYRAARVGAHYRALGIETGDGENLVWFWIGSHAQYDHILKH